MKPCKPTKLTRKDIAWQQQVEKRIKTEKVQLDNPNGREKFFKVLSKPFKKK